MKKSFARILLFGLILFTGVSAFYSSKLDFNYDFESFFPQNDPDLDFFLDYRNTFENDNDYFLISIGNGSSVFDSTFLHRANLFSEELASINHVENVASPTKIKVPVYNSFAFMQIPLLHLNNPKKFKNDSIRISKSLEFSKTFFSSDYQSLCIVINHSQNISKAASDELIISLESVIAKYNFTTIHYAGKVRGQKTYLTKMQFELLLFLSISIVLVILFLFLTFRSVFGIVVPILTVLIAIIGVLAIMQLSGKSLDVMSTLLPTILFVVGMSDAVHILNRYIEELRSGKAQVDAIKVTFKEVGLATLFTSITTAVGFITLLMVPIKPMSEFGLYSAIGVLLAFVIAITFLPSALSLLKPPKISFKKSNRSFWNKTLSTSFLFVLRNPKKIVITYSFVFIAAIIGILQLKVDYKLLEDLSEKDPLQQDFRFFENNYSGIRPFEMAIETKGKNSIMDYEVMLELDKLDSYLYDNYEAGFILSPLSIVKVMNKAAHSGNSTYYKLPETEAKYKSLLKKINKSVAKKELNKFLNDTKTLARFTGKMDDIGSRQVKFKNKDLATFFNTNINTSLIGYTLTGTALLVDKNNESLALNMIVGLALAFLLIAVLIGFIFKSFKMALISIIPNAVPLAIIGGIMGYMGTNINMSTSIIFSIAFGIAVDDTIHFLSKYKIESGKNKSSLYALKRTYISTGKAIILTTLILCGGFISLIFSDFKSTFLIGSYVGLTLFLAVITDMILLPILLVKKKKSL